jgi:hypothetical protein
MEDSMKHIGFIAATMGLLLTVPAWARKCQAVGGVLMTNIGTIEGVTNLGPVSGDLQGSIAATIKGQDNRKLCSPALLGDECGRCKDTAAKKYWVTRRSEVAFSKRTFQR